MVVGLREWEEIQGSLGTGSSTLAGRGKMVTIRWAQAP